MRSTRQGQEEDQQIESPAQKTVKEDHASQGQERLWSQ